MNFYIITEGKTEKIVYPHWIKLINPDLIQINAIDQVNNNNFYIISARGYPQIFDMIDSAIEDVNLYPKFNRLVISLDSDDLSFEEKTEELLLFLQGKPCQAKTHIIIQHFCFETWALGNRLLMRKNPQSSRLKNYVSMFNVRDNDPELLPPNREESLTRSQFAEKYLKAALNDRYGELTYSKGKPTILTENGFFYQINKRLSETGHIASFSSFISAFQ